MKNRGIKIVLSVIIVLILIAAVIGFFIFGKLSKVNTVKISKSSSNLGIDKSKYNNNNSDYINNNYTNILLLGVDSRNPKTDPGLADSIMILTIDKAHNKIKLTSLMRDMIIDNIQGEGATAGTTRDRINVIYKQGGGVNGGGQYAIKAINSNFNTNIKDYIKIDFSDFDKMVDAVGGVDINISDDEVKVANGYIQEVAKIEGIKPAYLTHGGLQHLSGIQALGYCRIRYVGAEDFQRTERQRTVLTAVFKKISSLSASDATKLTDTILPCVETSLSSTDILTDTSYIMLHKMNVGDQLRLPEDGYNYSVYINNTYFLGWDKTKNDADLLKFIYEEDVSKLK